MMKLVHILLEEPIFVPRRIKEREEDYEKTIHRRIQKYIEEGSKGDLNLSHIPITSLPDNLTEVRGNLDLSFTHITSLPDNLRVEGYLDLQSVPITSLPDNLTVRGTLVLRYSFLDSLPSNLKVGRNFLIYKTPLSLRYRTDERVRRMIEEKGGYVEGNIFCKL